jgi:hypothetical protein
MTSDSQRFRRPMVMARDGVLVVFKPPSQLSNICDRALENLNRQSDRRIWVFLDGGPDCCEQMLLNGEQPARDL